MSNLGARIASALVMAPLVIAGVLWLPGAAWPLVAAVVPALAGHELGRLARHAGHDVGPLVPWATYLVAAYAGIGGAPTRWVDGDGGLRAALAIVVVAAFVVQIARPPERRSVAAWGLAVAFPAYVGGMAGYAIGLRALDDGVAWLVTLLLLVWTNDSAAYFGGRALGRHPLAPALSPKKTWEGAAVGTMATIAVALLIALLPAAARIGVAPHGLATAPAWQAAALGLAIAVAGPLGDLSHSFVKRQFGAKDASHLIPGHGGVWDRIDSLLFAAPVVYWAALLVR